MLNYFFAYIESAELFHKQSVMQIKSLNTFNESGKKVLVRVDYNVPMQEGIIQDDTRIKATLPTIKLLLAKNSKIILCSHLGRPDGQVKPEFSLAPIAAHLSKLLEQQVKFANDCIGEETVKTCSELAEKEIVLLENLRFHAEEESNDQQFCEQLAALADIYVNDAFGTAHRKHASTYGVGAILPAYAGLLMENEISKLYQFLNAAPKPMTLIVGGSKIDTKIGILENFIDKADNFVIGGSMANTFLAAQGLNVGKSKFEADKVDLAKKIINDITSRNKQLYLPEEVVTATEFNKDALGKNVAAIQVSADEMILDVGPQSAAKYAAVIQNSQTIIWNGPVGVYEFANFQAGTKAIADALVEATKKGSLTLIGGGDSQDALNKFGIADTNFTHVSTGGGAMLEYMEGKVLPGVELLIQK